MSPNYLGQFQGKIIFGLSGAQSAKMAEKWVGRGREVGGTMRSRGEIPFVTEGTSPMSQSRAALIGLALVQVRLPELGLRNCPLPL